MEGVVMETKHTPGPWWVDDMACSARAVANRAATYPSGLSTDEKTAHMAAIDAESAANAALIAAAPELLSALRMARDYLEGIAERNNDEETDATLRYVDAALAKAEGR
jgi:predicted mannosyl-3-phosphoglycerate phosphatase (HAD superfamily)